MTDAWIAYLQHERRLAAGTLEVYRRSVERFLNFLSALNLTPEQVDARVLRTFMGARQKVVTPRTLNLELAAIRSYFAWLDTRHGVTNSIVRNARGPRTIPSLPRPVPAEDVLRMIECAGATNRAMWENRRDQALLTLLWGCGLRISEALALKGSDFPLADVLRIKGKGGVERLVPVLPAVKEAVHEYYWAMAQPPADDEPLFLGTAGSRYVPRDAQRMVERVRTRLGLPDSVTPHALRHSFATDLLGGGADLRSIQELLGHASVSTTAGYAAVDRVSIMRGYNAAHPHAQG